MKPQQRFIALDGLRGIAAICVALLHFEPELMPGGYLAVDLFFVLSGFVLVRAYGPRFEGGLSGRKFMLARLVRLYPLYAIGLVFGSVFILHGIAREAPGHMPLGLFAGAFAFNALMLPDPLDPALFPINQPAWSLFFEVLANLALAVGLIDARPRTLARLCALAGLGLVLGVVLFRESAGGHSVVAAHLGAAAAGFDWSGLPIGLLRVAYSFTMGMLIARLPARPVIQSNAIPVLACAVLLACLWLPLRPETREWPDLAFMLVVSPLLVLLCAGFQPQGRHARAAALAGEVSYALYAVHVPVLKALQLLDRKGLLPVHANAALYLAVALAAAWLATPWIDLPVRRLLERRLRLGQASPGSEDRSPSRSTA